jgi:hypothetical protein
MINSPVGTDAPNSILLLATPFCLILGTFAAYYRL